MTTDPNPAPRAPAGPPHASPLGPLVPASADLADYLAADEVIDHDHPEIRALAARLRRTDRVATARALFEYVRDEIDHSADVDHWSGAYRASDVLARRNGICHAKAHLLAALLRAEGIPAGICYQKLEVLHGLNGIHFEETGQWVRLDPRGNKGGADAHFATEPAEERTAWANDPDAGNFHYPTVHPTPPADLRAALAEARVGERGYGHLPREL
ncbi:transglutaminase family protein [Kitasatospora paracochleata]|uniref:Transglutaminase-like putative cysteine protease n=1 Tax=Kitasatospora paracochleata TaxID=58354 RepID=A0ABT1IPV1_9ACTN|nr:transglutaminase family protein [Kitasatospora paracochleata]MCP2306946.1 transglutaminase-like putative cysteine protease [Kitasatospora paracochleata]